MPAEDERADDHVKVAVRVRPMIPKEKLEQQSLCLKVHPAERQLVVGKDRAVTFDFVFGEDASQQSVYDEACAPLVEACMQGYNATVFAYGQTGSGKTYTMGSGSLSCVAPEMRGVVPRVVDGLFEALRARADEAEFLVRATYLEIYNEEVKDLLNPRTPAKSISIREDASGGIFLTGVHERAVGAKEELFECLEAGSAWRATGSTLMNAVSSRSHSLFSVIVEQRPKGAGAERIVSKLHLVDLAGSERAKKTGAVGQRFKESVSINQGLMALGNVIAALCDQQGRHKSSLAQHVPYRESKLTRLLQDSLGGNTRTLMVACVSPADGNLDESLNTLRYANRARNITNKPVVNREMPSVVDLREEIAALQAQLQRQQQQQQGQLPSPPPPPPAGNLARVDEQGGEVLYGDEDGELRGSSMPLPLSQHVLSVMRAELPAEQMQQLLAALVQHARGREEARRDAGLTPLGSPDLSPSASPLRRSSTAAWADASAAASAPLQLLRHTIQQWGRAEAQRAQLTHRLGTNVTLLEPDDNLATSGDPATSVVDALRRAAERGQLLQSLAVQQLAQLEEGLLAPAAASHDAIVAASTAGAQTRGKLTLPPTTPPSASRPWSAPPRRSPTEPVGALHAGGEGEGAPGALAAARAHAAEEVVRLRNALAAREADLHESRAHSASLASELAEARADLGRDEQIFAEKLKELRELHRAYGSLREAHAALQASLYTEGVNEADDGTHANSLGRPAGCCWQPRPEPRRQRAAPARRRRRALRHPPLGGEYPQPCQWPQPACTQCHPRLGQKRRQRAQRWRRRRHRSGGRGAATPHLLAQPCVCGAPRGR
jgi:hypothetical protein